MCEAVEESVRRVLRDDPAFVELRQSQRGYEIVLKKGEKLATAFAFNRVLGPTRFVEAD
jgi:hypothetical protein